MLLAAPAAAQDRGRGTFMLMNGGAAAVVAVEMSPSGAGALRRIADRARGIAAGQCAAPHAARRAAPA